MRNFLKTLGKAGELLASPAVVFWTFPWLLVLLIAGTWMQRDMGLYEAQKLLLSSFIVWLGPLPLPGMAITVFALFLSMTVKFLFFSPFRFERIGIILSHLGVLILLLGGIVTFFSQEEWLLTIPEGEESNLLSDYHQRVLKIYRDGNLIGQIPYEDLTIGKPLVWPENPQPDFSLTPRFLCKNCKSKPPETEEVPRNRFGILQKISLDTNTPSKEDSGNISGIEIELKGAGEKQDGLYATLEDVPVRPVIETKLGTIELQMSRRETALPFSVYLEDFKKETYPGIEMAKAYSSKVIVKDGDLEWPALIEMNKPLRYKGYTFYQSSFMEGPSGDQTVLSVVRNKGRLFPYIASGVILLGLLFHCFILLNTRNGKKS